MSDAYKVIYSPEALDDIRKIYSYITFELLVPDTVLYMANRILKATFNLNNSKIKVKKNPPTVREYSWGIRFFVHLRHHLFFACRHYRIYKNKFQSAFHYAGYFSVHELV